MTRLILATLLGAHALTGCESGLQVESEGVIDARCIETNGKDCVARDSAAAEQGFQFVSGRSITNLDDPQLRWTPYARANGGKVTYALVVAEDQACSKPVATFQKLTDTQQDLSFLPKDGTYHFCLFAEVKDQKLAALNNGMALVVDRTPPRLDALEAYEKNASFPIDLTIYDLTDVSVQWRMAAGPGEATFSDPGSRTTNVALSAEGSYRLTAEVSDKAGNKSTKFFDVIWDQTPPKLDFANTLFLGSRTELSPPVEASDVVLYKWSVERTPNGAALLTFSDPVIRNPLVSASVNGVYEARLTVSDRAGNTATDIVTIDWNTSPIVFTSIALVNQAADRYINALESTASDVIVGDPVGSDFTVAHYKLVPSGDDCASIAMWDATKPLASSAKADGMYKVCVRLSDNRGKTPAYGSSMAFTRKVTPPAFESIALAGEAADGYLNRAERAGTNVLVADLKASGYDSVAYALAPASAMCSGLATYQAAAPRSNSTAFGADQSYKVCVRLSDLAGNPARFGESNAFVLDTVLPVLASFDAINEASDGFVSLAEIASVNPAFSLSATGYNTVRYTGFLNDNPTVSCDAAKAYPLNSIPLIKDMPAVDASYVVCARLSDAAGNELYGRSRVVMRSTVAPSAVLSGHPTGPSNATALAIAVSGSGVSHYRHKIGGADLDCAAANGYGSERAQTLAITDGIGGLPDGMVKVCVVARNTIGSYQSFANATSVSWVKDTQIPTVTIQPLSINKANQASAIVSGTCSENGLTVIVGGAKTGSASCAGGMWSTSINYSTVADGNVAITANHNDAAGNKAVQAALAAVKDATPPAVTISPLGFVANANKTDARASGTCSENGRDVVIGGAKSGTVACNAGSWTITFDLSSLPDGSIALTADHVDAFDNAATRAAAAFTKDTVNPTVSLNALPVINVQNKAAVPVSGACSESGRAVAISGAVTATATCQAGSWSASLNYASAGDGSVAIAVDHADAAGNQAASANGSFVKDATPPTVTINQLVAINSANNAQVPVAGTCSESGREVRIGGAVSAVASCANGVWAHTLNYSTQPDGNVAITVQQTDAAGNASPVTSATFLKDTSGPTVTIHPLVINAANQNGAVVSGSCSESGRTITIGGSVNANATCSNGAWNQTLSFSAQADGEVLLTADHSDAAGNAATQSRRNVVKDTVLPTLSLDTVPVINAANRKSVTLSGACSENGQSIRLSGPITSSTSCAAGAWAAIFDFSTVADGTPVLKIDHADVAGNAAAQVSRSLTKDTVIPTVTLAPLVVINTKNKNAVPLSGTCSENGISVMISGDVSGEASCAGGAWSKTLDYAATSDGTVSVQIRQSDAAGNPSAVVSGTFTKDTASPSVSVQPIVINIANKSAVALSGSCSESGQPVSIGGPVPTSATCTQGAWSKTVNYAAQPDGTVTVGVDHKDAAGNDAPTAERALPKDTVAPVVTAQLPPPVSIGNKNAVPLSGTCSENGREVILGGGVNASAPCESGTWAKNVDLAALSDGSITLTAKQTDQLGNAHQINIVLTKDTVAPNVSLQDVIINGRNKQAVTLTGACSENGRAVAITGALSTNASCASGTWTKIVDLSSQPDGDVALSVQHDDAAGNAHTATRVLTKDTLNPNVSLDALVVVNNINKTQVPLSGACSENGQPVVIGGARAATVLCAFGVWATSIDYSGVADGSFGVTVDHTDAAGNSATRVSGSLKKDTVAPSITIAPLIVNIANNSAAPLSGTCSENDASVLIGGSAQGSATCSGGTWTVPYDFSSALDGALTITAALQDDAGNSAQTSRVIQKDTAAPTVALNILVAINTSNQNAVPVSGSCSENGQSVSISGAIAASAICQSGSWSKTLDYRGQPDGALAIQIAHKDLAGNEAIPASSQITKDTSAPTVNAGPDRQTSGTVNQDATVTGAVSFAWSKVSGPGGVTFGSPDAEDTTITVTTDGTYVLRLTATDAAGNTAFDEMLLTRDSTPPNAFLSGAPSGTSDVNVLNISVGGAGVAEYAFKVLDGGATDCSSVTGYSGFRSVTTPITNDITASPYGAGMKVCVIARDELGNAMAPAQAASASWHRDAPTYRHYRLMMTSLSGDCVSGRAVVENLELRFADQWHPSSFSGASGIIGFINPVVVSASSANGGNEAWKAFDAGYWQGGKEFETIAPYNAEAPSFIRWDFGENQLIAVQGLRLKGGTGNGAEQHCAPDAYRLEGSVDGTTWREVVGSARTLPTEQQVQYLFRPRPGKVDALNLVPGDAKVAASWSFAGGNEVGHVIVRRIGAPVTWSPSDGINYPLGDVDPDHTVVYAGASVSHLDASLAGGKEHHYAIFAYDQAKRYAPGTAAKATPYKVSECRALTVSCTEWCSTTWALSCESAGLDGDAADGASAASAACDAPSGTASCSTVNEAAFARCRCQ